MNNFSSLPPVDQNMLTFEVEDRMHVEFPDNESQEIHSRIITLLIKIMDLLDEEKARATFFVLGWVARKFPEVIGLIDARGHEVASHGLSHGDIRYMPMEKFSEELAGSKNILEEIVKKPVIGYKGACPYLGRESLPRYKAIGDAGYLYDCSMSGSGPRLDLRRPFPVSLDDNRVVIAMPQSERKKGLGKGVRFGEKLRILPAWYSSDSIRKLNNDGFPAMINMKLWELDIDQSRAAGRNYLNYFSYDNINLAEEKLERLLKTFKFTTCAEVLGFNH